MGNFSNAQVSLSIFTSSWSNLAFWWSSLSDRVSIWHW